MERYMKSHDAWTVPEFTSGRCFATRLKEHRRDLELRNLVKIDDDNINKCLLW